jgi:hypothetical protein
MVGSAWRRLLQGLRELSMVRGLSLAQLQMGADMATLTMLRQLSRLSLTEVAVARGWQRSCQPSGKCQHCR